MGVDEMIERLEALPDDGRLTRTVTRTLARAERLPRRTARASAIPAKTARHWVLRATVAFAWSKCGQRAKDPDCPPVSRLGETPCQERLHFGSGSAYGKPSKERVQLRCRS